MPTHKSLNQAEQLRVSEQHYGDSPQNIALLPWIGVAAVAVGILAFALRPALNAAPSDAIAASDTAQSSSTNEARQLQEQIAALRAEVRDLRINHPTASDVQHPSSRMADRERLIEEDRRQHERLISSIDADFQREPIDPSWSARTSTRLRESVTPFDAMRGGLRNVQCRARTCRVEIADIGSGALQQQLPLWLEQLVDVLPRSVVRTIADGDHSTSMVLYLMPAAPVVTANR